MKNTYIYIYIYINLIFCFYSLMVMLVWSSRAVRESSHIQRGCQESELPTGLTSQNYRHYVVLKPLSDLNGHTSSLTQCLFSIGHGLHTHFYFFGSQFLDFVYDWMYQSTTSARLVCRSRQYIALSHKWWQLKMWEIFLLPAVFVSISQNSIICLQIEARKREAEEDGLRKKDGKKK